MTERDQPTIDAANELLRTTMTAAIYLPLADGKSAYLGGDSDIAMLLADKDQRGAAASGKVDLQACPPADGPLTEVVTTIFRRARTSDTEACTFSASSFATPGAAVRGEAVAGNDSTDLMARFEKWKAYPLPALNSDGHFEKDWLHREFVAFKAGVVSARAADAPSEPSEPSFHVIVDEDEEPVFVAKLRKSAQEHINDACDVDVESAGKWKSIPVFKRNPAAQSKPAAWIDQFGNVFPLGAYQPSGKPSYLDADKRGWKPLFRAADALDSQPTEPYKLESNEQYNVQMAAIGAAAFGYCKLDGIQPEYMTQTLRDVVALYEKYAALLASSQPTDGGVRK